MKILLPFFIRFLLAPILLLIGIYIMSRLSKTKAKALKMVSAIIFILILAIILALPSLLGFLKYEFIWDGLVFSILIYITLGFIFNIFSKSQIFQKIGIGKDATILLVILTIAMIIGMWCYYLAFDYLIKLPYGAWAMLSVSWFIIPVFYRLARLAYQKIPQSFYDSWDTADTEKDSKYWENVDTFKLMQVTVKIKRRINDNQDSSFSVKIPEGMGIGVWFNRFVEDQNTRFPNSPIVIDGDEGELGWIFQTNKWLPFPLFKRVLDFKENITFNNIRNKDVIYINRVVKKKETEGNGKK